MSHVLIGTTPATGHVRPLLPIARELISGGHQVLWYAGSRFRHQIEAVGARFAPMVRGLDFDDADLDPLFPAGDRPAPGVKRLTFDLEHVFLRPLPDWISDLDAYIDDFAPDVMVCDQAFAAVTLAGAVRDIPTAAVSVSPLMISSIDTAPPGTGLAPNSSALGRMRNRMLNRLVRRTFRQPQRTAEAILEGLGLPPRSEFVMDWTALMADIYLMPTIPAFEYPRSDLPATVRFVGALLPTGIDRFDPPAWWGDLAAARSAGTPVVLLTQGTVATDPKNLLLPAIRALGGTDTLVVATTGGPDPEEVLPAGQRPANLRLERFVPFTDLLPQADLMVTNGGYGGVQLALAHGVPLVVAGKTEDKMEVSARVRWSGAGVALMTDTPDPRQIARAARTVLTDRSYRARARELRDGYAECDGTRNSVDAILELVHATSPAPAR